MAVPRTRCEARPRRARPRRQDRRAHAARRRVRGHLHRHPAAHRGHRVDRAAGRRCAGRAFDPVRRACRLTTRTVEALRAADAGDIAVVVGGTIPEATFPNFSKPVPRRCFPPARHWMCWSRSSEADVRKGRGVMRLGVMIGAERGDMARKVKKLLDDTSSGQSPPVWTPRGCRRCPTTSTR